MRGDKCFSQTHCILKGWKEQCSFNLTDRNYFLGGTNEKISLIFIALSFVLLFLFCGNNEVPRYSSTGDRDTIESFGVDGQFAIYKCVDNNFNKKLDLYDAKNDDGIDMISYYKEI